MCLSYSETFYKYSPSTVLWPSQADEATFVAAHADGIEATTNFSSDAQFYRRNYLQLEVFFETLQQRKLTEAPKYTVRAGSELTDYTCTVTT